MLLCSLLPSQSSWEQDLELMSSPMGSGDWFSPSGCSVEELTPYICKCSARAALAPMWALEFQKHDKDAEAGIAEQ